MAKLPEGLLRRQEQAKLLQENLRRAAASLAATPAATEEVLPVAIEPAPRTVESSPSPAALSPETREPVHSLPSPELLELREQIRRVNENHQSSLSEAKELKNQLRKLEDEKSLREASVVTTEQLTTYFSAEELEQFGEAECRLIVATAKKISGSEVGRQVASEVSKMREELAPQFDSLAQAREQLFFQSVGAGVPDWRKINKDPGWVQWLTEQDPIARRVRQTILNEARQSLDAAAVIDFFLTYKATQRPAQAAAPAPSALRGIHPTGRPPNVPETAAGNSQIITRAQITEKAAQYTSGKISKEAYRIFQAETDRALREGRIQ